MIVGALTGYGGRAYAQGCTNAGGSSFTCTGITDTGQTIAVDNATVSTIAPFEVNTTDPIAINITGDGALSYTDAYASDLTAATTALQVSATGDDGGTPGSIAIDSDGVLMGGQRGIYAFNQGTGATTINATGAVTGTTGDAISAINNGTNITVTTGPGTVMGGNNGISAENSGSGFLSVIANGDVTGTNNDGIFAENNAGTNVSVTTGAAVAGGYHGIYALNHGTGSTVVTASGDVTGSTGYGIYAGNADTSSTYISVTTAVGTTVTGYYVGISVKNYGTGATTIDASSAVTGTGHGIHARNVSATGGALSVTTGSGAIYGTNDDGIYVTNASTGSATTVTAGGDVTGAGRHGINAQTDGVGLTITTAAGSRVNGNESGIYASNQGTGYTTVTVRGHTYGYPRGVVANNAASTTSLTVTTDSGSRVRGDTAIYAANAGSGDLRITANGDVYGGIGAAIDARLTGTGDGYITTSSTVRGARGITTSGGGSSGAWTIEANGNVTGYLLQGISIGANNGASVTTAASTLVSGYSDGIAGSTQNGALSIIAHGDVTGQNGSGIDVSIANATYGTNLSVTTDGTVMGSTFGIRADHAGTGSLTITTSGNVTGEGNDGILIANTSGNTADVTVDASSNVTSNGADAGDFAMQINSGAANVTVAGALNGGGGGAIQFANATNTLELVTGASVNGNVVGGTGTDTLILSGASSGAFNVSQLQNFEAVDVEAGTWSLSGATTADAQVNGGTLMGTGTFGTLAVNSGTLAPGNSIGTMTVNGAFTLSAGAVYEVEVNAAGESDKVIVNGTVNLTGSVLRVLAASGDYQTSTDYTIIENDGTDAVVGTFASVTSSLAFLIPTVFYAGGDGNDVVLTLERNETLFPDVARTRNQRAVAGALEQFPTNNALFLAVLNQTVAGARAAFDALSGEIHATIAGSLIDDSRYVRDAVLGRLVQATYTNNAGQVAALAAGGPQVASLDSSAMALGYGFDGKSLAVPEPEPLAFWTRAYGVWGTFDGDGNAATLDRDLGGFVSGMDAEIWNGWRAGLATGASFSNVDVDARYSSADVETYHLGGYLGGMASVFALRGGGVWAWSDVDTSRAVLFPGFYERQKARYDADTGQLFGEVAYPTQMMGVALEPFGGIAYVTTDSETFREHGGPLASLRGSADQDVGYTTVGLRAGQTMQVAGMLITPNLSVAWLHAFDGVTPEARLAFANTGIGFTVYGVPLAQNSGLIDVGLDFALGPDMTAGVSYSGQFGEDVTDNGVKGRFTWLF